MLQPYFQKLDGDGITWVQQCLEQGEAFAQAVLSKVDLNKGTVSIIVARKEHQASITENRPLSWGTTLDRVVQTDIQSSLLFQKLKVLEKEHGQLAIVLEDNLRHPGDKSLGKFPKKQLFQIGNRYLHVKSLATIRDSIELSHYLNWSSGYPLNAFAVIQSVIPDRLSLNEADVNNLAAGVQGIINGAYDNETYTLWLKVT